MTVKQDIGTLALFYHVGFFLFWSDLHNKTNAATQPLEGLTEITCTIAILVWGIATAVVKIGMICGAWKKLRHISAVSITAFTLSIILSMFITNERSWQPTALQRTLGEIDILSQVMIDLVILINFRRQS